MMARPIGRSSARSWPPGGLCPRWLAMKPPVLFHPTPRAIGPLMCSGAPRAAADPGHRVRNIGRDGVENHTLWHADPDKGGGMAGIEDPEPKESAGVGDSGHPVGGARPRPPDAVRANSAG